MIGSELQPAHARSLSLVIGLAAVVCGCMGNPGQHTSAPRTGDRPSAAAAPNARAEIEQAVTAEGSISPWSFGDRPGRIIQTAHFRLYTTTHEPTLAALTPGYLEAVLLQARSTFTGDASPLPLPPPNRPLETFLLADRQAWLALTRQWLGGEAGLFTRIERGGFAWSGRVALHDLGPPHRDTFALLAHEGWHQYGQATFVEPLPPWLDEALATYLEGHRRRPPTTGKADDARTQHFEFLPWFNPPRFDALRRAAAQRCLLPLDELIERAGPDLASSEIGVDAADAYYAQVWALAHFLIEHDGGRLRGQLAQVLRDAAIGQMARRVHSVAPATDSRVEPRPLNPTAIFRTYFFRDLSQASEAYAAFVDSIIATGSRTAIVEGRSPLGSACGKNNHHAP